MGSDTVDFSIVFRLALANLRFPATPDEAVALAERAIADAAGRGAAVVCFPECFVPGYRAKGRSVAPPDAAFLERAWAEVGAAAARAGVAVVLGTERLVAGGLRATALVVQRDGTRSGFQDKVQLDPSEEATYTPGTERRLFQAGPLIFGVVICHEGWRYPETVRWAAVRGAQVVFHPQFHEAEPGGHVPSTYGEPANTFHEKAVLCRAADNSCWFATVNYGGAGSPTTTAIARPDGALHAFQPYGREGLLVAEIDLDAATGLLARKLKSDPPPPPEGGSGGP
jgi:predicted amidohydrolase